jgi:hypothetical protein
VARVAHHRNQRDGVGDRFHEGSPRCSTRASHVNTYLLMISKLFLAQSLRTSRPECAEIAQRRRCVGPKKACAPGDNPRVNLRVQLAPRRAARF